MGPEGISWVGTYSKPPHWDEKKDEMTQSYVYTQSLFRYLFGCMCVCFFFLVAFLPRE